MGTWGCLLTRDERTAFLEGGSGEWAILAWEGVGWLYSLAFSSFAVSFFFGLLHHHHHHNQQEIPYPSLVMARWNPL